MIFGRLTLLSVLLSQVYGFVPKEIMTFVIRTVDETFKNRLGYYSESIVHEEIIERGIARSVARFFYEQENGASRIDLSKLDTDYRNLKNVYRDYYEKTFCKIDIEELISDVFQPQVASVDFDDETKDLASAHFDAEQFNQSNQRVMEYMDIIQKFLNVKDYSAARKYAARILHTIHDFYSHSNWVEMGNKKINKEIGTRNFSKYDTTDLEDPNTCVSNCSTIEIECNTLIRALVKVVKKLGVRSSIINCPIKYFRCNGNIVTNSKLVSGFYVDQGIEKPENTMKCSHGGILDSSSYKKAVGGINKDSGYFVFSPHANLHLEAAKLAIDHTEFFFEEIRKKIGNDEFSKFLNLEVSKSFLNSINGFIQICDSKSIQIEQTFKKCFNFLILFFFLEKIFFS